MNDLTALEERENLITDLETMYLDAIEIVDIKGDEYIAKHIGEDDGDRFKEVVDEVWDLDLRDGWETVTADTDVLEQLSTELMDYLSKFSDEEE